MNLLAALTRRSALWTAIAVGGALVLFLFASLAYRVPMRPHGGPTRKPTARPYVTAAPSWGTPSEQQASEVAAAFGQTYFSGGDVLPYLTPAETRAWTQQASAQRQTATTMVSGVTATSEGAASDGSLGFVVDAQVSPDGRSQQQAVEVFVVEQQGHYLIERVDP